VPPIRRLRIRVPAVSSHAHHQVLTLQRAGAAANGLLVAVRLLRIVLVERQRDDLHAVREALVTEMLANPPVSRTRAAYEKQRAYEISIRIVDGKFDVANDAIPNALPLPGKLQARGYPASLAVPRGGLPSLPTLDQQLRDLYKRRDAAHADLAALLPAEVAT